MRPILLIRRTRPLRLTSTTAPAPPRTKKPPHPPILFPTPVAKLAVLSPRFPCGPLESHAGLPRVVPQGAGTRTRLSTPAPPFPRDAETSERNLPPVPPVPSGDPGGTPTPNQIHPGPPGKAVGSGETEVNQSSSWPDPERRGGKKAACLSGHVHFIPAFRERLNRPAPRPRGGWAPVPSFAPPIGVSVFRVFGVHFGFS